jgi:uncharacterized tellurite resistance protein B-like protein
MSMFDLLRNFFSDERSGSEDAGVNRIANDQQLAEAALMFHVIAADGRITDAEQARMKEILIGQYDLSEGEFSQLFAAAREADGEAVDLYRFTSLLKARLDRNQRIAIIEHMWEMVFADGKMHELEDNVVWRIAQLMEVETQDRIAMKQRVRARRES